MLPGPRKRYDEIIKLNCSRSYIMFEFNSFRYWLVVLAFLFPVVCHPQTDVQDMVPVSIEDLPWFEGFENDGTEKHWKLNGVFRDLPALQKNLNDKWYFSKAEHYSGERCLLISDTENAGSASVYGNKKNIITAYREFDLPQGKYELSFAWRCKGESKKYIETVSGTSQIVDDPIGDGFYVAWLPGSTDIVSSSSNDITSLPVFSQLKASHKGIKGDENMFNGNQFWSLENAVVDVPSDGVYRLYFVWYNDGDRYWKEFSPSACIDNIQLERADAPCSKPENLSAVSDGLNVTVTWSGSASEYEVSYRSYGESYTRFVRPNVKTNSVTITDMKEGLYDFFVRAICAPGDTSMYATLSEILVFDRENRCIQFDDFNNASCGWKRKTNGSDSYDDVVFNKNDIKKGGWNFGSESVYSRHTVHNHPGEVDPRTNGKLKTIPPGEVMSVRLGSWETGGNIQYIEYEYDVHVLSTQILYLNYAVVLGAPFDRTHMEPDENGQFSKMPHFSMEIKDTNGRQLDPVCASADFYANPNDTAWHTEVIGDGDSVVYKNWTTVAVNLSGLVKPSPGMVSSKIFIKFIVSDCVFEGHFGYTYFTLRCEEMTGKALKCGNEPLAVVEAPEGFFYEWYRPDNTTLNSPNPVPDSKERVYEVQNPVLGTYLCKLIYTEHPDGCSTDLKVNLEPRQPRSVFVPVYAPRDCKNIYRFTNSSHIIEGENEIPTSEKPQYFEWNFGDGSPVLYDSGDVEHEFPADGGKFSVSLLTAINDNSCTDVQTIELNVPSISANSVQIDTTVCSNKPYVYPDNRDIEYTESGTYVINSVNGAGCDVEVTIRLTVIDSLTVHVSDTICEGEEYAFGITSYSKSGVYRYP